MMVTTVSNVPLGTLSSLGMVKTGALQLHTIKQVSVINAPDIANAGGSSDGDLVIDSGDVTHGQNGHLKIMGGYEGANAKSVVLETGVWDRDHDVGPLTPVTATDSDAPTTLEQHLSAGTLMTGLRIPVIAPDTAGLQEDMSYALRNVGTNGHVAWGSINDIAGDLRVSGGMSVSSDAHLGADLTVQGSATVGGDTLTANDLALNGNAALQGNLSVLGAVDVQDTITVSGSVVMNSSLNVASAITADNDLNVTGSLVCTNANVETTLTVGAMAEFASDVSVAGDVTLNSLHVTGSISPLLNGFDVQGYVRIGGPHLDVFGTTRITDDVTMEGSVHIHGDTFYLNGSSVIDIGVASSEISITGYETRASTSLILDGSLSVSSPSVGITLETPVLSVHGALGVAGEATCGGVLTVVGALTCASSHTLGDATVDGAATFNKSLLVGQDLNIDGNATIAGDLIVQGTTTTINTTELSVLDKTLELGVVATPSDIGAISAGVIIKGETDKSILYTRSATVPGDGAQQLSGFRMSEDMVLGRKTKPFTSGLGSAALDASPRSQVLHLGDVGSADGHWMVVSNISGGTLQFWYGHDIADDQSLDTMPESSARLAFEIRRPD